MGRKIISPGLRNENVAVKLLCLFIFFASITTVFVNVTFFSPTLGSKTLATVVQRGHDMNYNHVNSKGGDDKGVVTISNRVIELISRLGQHTCTDENITVRCICGANTQPNYLKNMIETYAESRYDSSLFEKCLNETLPFDGFTPLECWPKMFILASYPTSGNELARSILQKTTKRNTFLSEYHEPPPEVPTGRESKLYMLKPIKHALQIRTSNCDHRDESKRVLPFGMMGKSTIYKSHGPKGHKWRNTDSEALTNNQKFGGFTTGGIVHLARNPGDQLLRGSYRWSGKDTCHDYKCFLQDAHHFCDKAREKTLDWSLWHQFWLNKSSTTPHIIYHYENFSNATIVTQATEKVMDFLNELPPRQLGYSLRDELRGVIREPEYVHGTLMALVCGKDLAREMHKETKEVSEQLGYVFDDDSATWSLKE